MSAATSPVHDMSVAYALEGLEGIERLRFEGHLVQCAECRGDVEDVRDAAELLSVGIELAPPASLRTQVEDLTRLPVAAAAATEDTPGESPAPARRRRWFGGG
ncbi:zf-HC2 domain-containing protein [Nocardioides solisilvae]|uniref:zf-HC2 domain-containing protein n=1 Tax=Nocardioides solisilvae TaxID=1542435 RepID=UPI000D749CA5|nr:zf-HC2 domain-containing protein [Nocardioides solisilvae]